MCFATSAPLQGYLSMLDIETELIEGEIKIEKNIYHHVWLRLPDGRILDPTADQFDCPNGSAMPKVYLGIKPNWYEVNPPPSK